MTSSLRSLLVLLLLLGACIPPPVQDEVTIEFHDDEPVATVTARQTFRLDAQSSSDRSRIASSRDAALLGTDPWSVRFGRLAPASERITFDRVAGELERVTHSAAIPAHEVERFFSDASLTLKFSRGDGWAELAIYPGTSNRATREQQRHFTEGLERWSRVAARYYAALDHLYSYLDENPQRARYVFAAVLNERAVDGAPSLVTEEEQPYVDAVVRAMDEIAVRMDEGKGYASLLAEEADLIHNPFPAKLTILLPGALLARQGFNATADGKGVVVEPIDLFKRIVAMEGRWASPDPVAMLLRDEAVTAESLSLLPRKSAPVTTALDIQTAIREHLTRPQTYLVRWRE